jgi:ATP-dependent helicase/nuclease subunit A
VINLLSVVEDPFDDVALAGALRSPFFGVSDEGLFRLATGLADGGLTAGLYRLGEVAGMSDLDRRRAARALELLAQWRSDKDRIPMARLVARILDESGFEGAVVCEFLGDRKLANTRKIVRLARDFDRQGGFTLAEFVARLRADLENEPREEQAATTDEAGASIRLMSIHQAKGLEFPIVVLPDLARASRPRSPLLACRPDLGLVVRPPLSAPTSSDAPGEPEGRDPAWRAYLAMERADDEQESLRLFYVAATRARDALMLSAGLGPDEPVPSNAVAMRLLDERFDRRTGTCLVEPAPHDPAPPPAVRVCPMEPPGDRPAEAAAPSPSPRLSIAAIEEAMAQAGPPSDDEPTGAGGPPRYEDLDPTIGLPPRAARLDGLIRAIVRDPRWRRGEAPAFEPLAARVGARLVPAPGPALVRDAARRLDALWDLPAFRALRAATSVGDDLEFTLAEGDTVYHGAGDLAFRDREGRWHLVVLADAGAGPERQRLRLRLAAMAARARGLEPIARGWLVRHGPDGSAHEEIVAERRDEAPVVLRD